MNRPPKRTLAGALAGLLNAVAILVTLRAVGAPDLVAFTFTAALGALAGMLFVIVWTLLDQGLPQPKEEPVSKLKTSDDSVVAQISVSGRLIMSEIGGPALEAMSVPDIRRLQGTMAGWIRTLERAIAKKRPIAETHLVLVDVGRSVKVCVGQVEEEDGSAFESACIARLLELIDDDPQLLEPDRRRPQLDEFEEPWPYRLERSGEEG